MANISFPISILENHGPSLRLAIEHVVDRDRRTCQMCGADENDICPYDGVQVTLFITHVASLHGDCELVPDNLRTVCSTCAQGLRMIYMRKYHLQNEHCLTDRLQLLAQIRRATIEDQKAVMNWLLGKFRLRALADK